MDIGIKLLPVMWECLCIPRHIHALFLWYGDGTTAQYVQIMTTGNSIDFGDIQDRQGGGSGGCSNGHGGLG